MIYKAYLIVICDKTTNKVLGAAIWSSPEWEQSRQLDTPTYVALATTGTSFANATESLMQTIESTRSRYHWLLKYLEK